MLTNREIATLFWLTVLVAWVTWKSAGFCQSVRDLIRLFLSPKIAGPIVVFALYVTALVAIAQNLGWWSSGLAKDTVVWFVVVGLPLLMNLRGASEDGFFRRTALRTLGLGGFVAFYLNLDPLPLAGELVVQPVLALAVGMSIVAARDPKTRPAKLFADGVVTVIVIALALVTANDLAANWATLDKAQTGRSFALSVWLTVDVLPFIFGFSLLSNYELAAMRVGFAAENKRAPWRAKAALVLGFRLSNRDLRTYGGARAGDLARVRSIREGMRIVAEYRASLREAEEAKRRAAERLRTYAGVKGTDEEGRQLDQREFKETKDALDTIATCQMGWYRNRGEGYRPDMLDILSNDFHHSGLSADHGITLVVSQKRQAWYAWRRTPIGWCFAIGAGKEPPDQWYYDGPEPPTGFPGKASGWRSAMDQPSPEWA